MSIVSAPKVSVDLLGNFAVRIDGAPVERWRAGKARGLFQYLVVNRDRVVLRDKLYEVLWPASEWTANSSSLKVAMHALRQILGIRPDGTGDIGLRILHQGYGYVLYADCVSIDVEEFETLIESGRAADRNGDTATALSCYEKAMVHYRGDFLAGESASWVVEQREWCKALALRALDRLTAEAVRRGDCEEVLAWCRPAIEIDPYREETYQLLMSVHGRFGELGSVRRWHEICLDRLRGELGVEPSMATERVFSQAMRGAMRPARQAAMLGGGSVGTVLKAG
jgi:DNA-binding SARP family transcriptional activator